MYSLFLQSFCNASIPPEEYTGKQTEQCNVLRYYVPKHLDSFHDAVVAFPPSLTTTTTAGLSIEMFKEVGTQLGWKQGVEYQFEVRIRLQFSIQYV